MSWETIPNRPKRGGKKTSNAKQRLMKEAQELAITPVENCNAAPLEDNIFEWHANISTPLYEGVCFHFIINFTEEYPKVAPKVKVCNRIDHPNVFGDYLCLDILTMSEETQNTPYRGWTSAYTVSSLLVQLQCFLFDVPKQSNGRGYKDSQYNEALTYRCGKCGHCGSEPFPAVVPAKRDPGFYRLRRLALIRKEADTKSDKVCELEPGLCVEVTRLEGRRARLNLRHFDDVRSDTGYCSVYTKQGVLLESILPSFPPGVYKTNVKTKVHKKDGSFLFDLARKKRITVEKLIPGGETVVAKLSTVPAKYRTLSMDMDDIYVDATALKLVESFDVEPVKKETVLDGESYWLHEFYGSVLDIILAMLDADTVNALSLCHEDLKKKVNSSQILLMKNYRCFFTLKTMREEDTVIGVGIKTEVMDKRSRHKKVHVRGMMRDLKRPVLQRLHPSFDFMAHEAFQDYKVTANVWKDCVNMDAFLPLFLNKTHGKRALPLAEKCILAMWKKENKRNSLNCERLMETLAKLMNTTVVNMNKCVDDVEVEEIQLFDSIKALEGYMAFHHLLLAFAIKYPKLVELANEKVRDFCKKEAVRDKEHTPDIGELIVYLSLSKYSWKQFFPAFVRELFDRNARWILAKYPGLRDVEPDKLRSCIRMTQSFLATKTGKRLAAFQCFFMNEIACPLELQGKEDKVQVLFKEYNARLGKPVAGMAERLQIHSRKVLAMSNWFDYFELVGFAAPSSVELSDWLRQSIMRSGLKRYHSVDQILRYSEQHVESPNYILHKNPFNCCCAGGQVFNLEDASSIETCDLVSKPKERIDIAFVVDCTGSMGSWLTQAKKSIQQIIRDVNEKTQFKKVRFALVPYRDHSPGEGFPGYVVKKFEFTSNLTQMQKNVDTLSAGGGADAPEAMSCGLATAAGLAWNRNAMQLLVHIGDEKPHGLATGGGDNYPNGCPDGHDALRVAHNLAKKGIPIYNVYCGYSNGGLTETFYHALSHLTHGQCVSLDDASTLSKIVLGAAMEEETMDKITQKVMPIWDVVHERHAHARDDQIIYEIYQRLKADKFKVKCVLNGAELGKGAMKSIETICFCTDLKQAKAMQEKAGEYFYSYSSGNSQITKATTKIINEGQVRKWYKRNKKMISIAEFRKKGCQYAQPRWQPNAALQRLNKRALAKFGKRSTKPWVKVDRKATLKVFNEAGKLAKESKTSTPLFCTAGTAAKAPAVSAWGTSKSSSPPPAKSSPPRARNSVVPGPRPIGSAPSGAQPQVQPPRYVPPNRRTASRPGPQNVNPRGMSAAPGSRPMSAAPGPRSIPTAPAPRPMSAVRGPSPAGPVAAPVATRTNMTPHRAPMSRGAPRPLARGHAPMSRNTSYPVNNSRSSSRSSTNSHPHFPGRGAPIQAIRTPSRSNSASRRAPIQTIRSSRSTSREPRRGPVMSTPPRPNVVGSAGAPRPTVTASPEATPNVFIKFDQKQIIADFLSSRLRKAGLNQPVSIDVQDGHACVTFVSAFDANQALRTPIVYKGNPLETHSTNHWSRQTRV